MNWLNNMSVGRKISSGFAILSLLIIFTIVTAMGRITDVQKINHRVFDLRTPTVLASTNMLNGINQSLAALRGYILLGKDGFKAERARSWESINKNFSQMENFSKSWTNPKNVERLREMKQVLAEFNQTQKEIEAISHTPENTPATKILITEAAPQASVMVAEITRMIDLEAKEAATPERKALLGMMADVRGTTGLGLANIRAFLLTGDEKFNQEFNKFWNKNKKRFADLSGQSALFTSEQKIAFNKLKLARSEFKELPPKMFAIRGSKQWKLDNYWLGTKAAPKAKKLVSGLSAMVENQNVLASTDVDAAKKSGDNLILFMMIVGFVVVILAIIVSYFIVRMITKPVAVAAEGLARIAEGDLSQRWEVTSKDELGNMLNDMNQMVDSLSNVVSEVRSSSSSIAESSTEISMGNNDLSNRTEAQASSLEETAASMEEMTSTVNQNASNTREANQLASGASVQAVQGGEVVSNAINAMTDISASSKKIADIIGVIDDIAFQTNLLALNAAVEAARAGEQGRGFAVVAGEVRILAGRSAEAAKEIKELIQDSVAKVDLGSKLVNESGETLTNIVDSVKKVSDIISEISAAGQEQASGIDQINEAVTQMDDATQQNAALVEQAAAASQSMENQAKNLNSQMEFFILGDSSSATAKNVATAKSKPPKKLPSKDVKPVVKAKVTTPVAKKTPAPAPVAKKSPAPAPAKPVVTKRATVDDDEWEEF